MIQEIAPKRLDNAFIQTTPEQDSVMLGFWRDMIYFRETGGQITFLTYGTWRRYWEAQDGKMPPCVYLFSIGQKQYFLTDISKKVQLDGFGWHRMVWTRSMAPREEIFAAATAWHLYEWYRDNRFCGRCMGVLRHDHAQRMLRCPDCGNLIFPRIAPAVIVGVRCGDRILMTKYADREYKRYALIAGFTEIGETAEETVAREVMEEVGLRVKNITYYKSQPWGFDGNLLLGFFCDLDGEDQIHLDETELSVAKWVHYRDITEDTEGLSLTRDMMTRFREETMRKKGESDDYTE